VGESCLERNATWVIPLDYSQIKVESSGTADDSFQVISNLVFVALTSPSPRAEVFNGGYAFARKEIDR